MGRGGTLRFPNPPSERAVLREWQEWHVPWRFDGSSVPPSAFALMWSTSVLTALRHITHSGSRVRIWARSCCHARP